MKKETTQQTPTINHNDWSAYDGNGYLEQHGVEVRDYKEDDTVRIGATLHWRDDLIVSSDGLIIRSRVAGWYLTRPDYDPSRTD